MPWTKGTRIAVQAFEVNRQVIAAAAAM
jgi:hypothetical protein